MDEPEELLGKLIGLPIDLGGIIGRVGRLDLIILIGAESRLRGCRNHFLSSSFFIWASETLHASKHQSASSGSTIPAIAATSP